jgi:hypothetical protein
VVPMEINLQDDRVHQSSMLFSSRLFAQATPSQKANQFASSREEVPGWLKLTDFIPV